MARRKQTDIEQEWFDVFAKWSKGDREAALRVLQALHRALPESRKSQAPADPAASQQEALL